MHCYWNVLARRCTNSTFRSLSASRFWSRRHHVHMTTSSEQFDRPCSERAVAHALQCATGRITARNDERAVLVHGDVHQWHALRVDGGFKLVDRDGLLAEAGYDLRILMREDRSSCSTAIRNNGHDGSPAVLAWTLRRSANGVVERRSTGLLCARIDLQPVGRHMLASPTASIGSHDPTRRPRRRFNDHPSSRRPRVRGWSSQTLARSTRFTISSRLREVIDMCGSPLRRRRRSGTSRSGATRGCADATRRVDVRM